METKKETIEYKFLRQNIQHHSIPKKRLSFAIYLSLFHLAFIVLYGIFVGYKYEDGENLHKKLTTLISMNSLVFIGLGFLMAFLQRYAYSAIGYTFLLGAYVLEWALLIRGWLILAFSHNYSGVFSINIDNILAADFCALTVLISFAVLIGRVSLSQLLVMATVEVIVQCVNELIGKNLLMAHDVGQSMYVHAFGAFFGLAVSKILHNREVETRKESSYYYSDVFAMLGCFFVWINWPTFNSINATGDGQYRAIMNTLLSMFASCVSTFIVSTLLGRGRLNMYQVQAATFAGGIVVGSVCDLPIQPYGALLCGTLAGVLSTLCIEYLSPALKNCYLHDTCGVSSVFGISGVLSGLIGALVALTSNAPNLFKGKNLNLDVTNLGNLTNLAPALNLTAPSNLNYTESSDATLTHSVFNTTDVGRTALQQAGFQIAGLLTTIGIAVLSGLITGLLMRIPIFEQMNEDDEMYDDELNWFTPEDFAHDLTEVRIKSVEEQELGERITPLN